MPHRAKAAIMAKRIPHPVCDVDSDVFWSEWRGPVLVGQGVGSRMESERTNRSFVRQFGISSAGSGVGHLVAYP